MVTGNKIKDKMNPKGSKMSQRNAKLRLRKTTPWHYVLASKR